MSTAVTPYGRSTSARQPGPSLVIGAGKRDPGPALAERLVDLGDAERGQRADDVLAGQLGHLVRHHRPVEQRPVRGRTRHASPAMTVSDGQVRAQPRNQRQPGHGQRDQRDRGGDSRMVRQRIRSSRCRDSFMYISGSLRAPRPSRSGTPSASPAHRDTSPSSRHAPTGTRRRDPRGVLRRPHQVIADGVRRHAQPASGPRSAARRGRASQPGTIGRRSAAFAASTARNPAGRLPFVGQVDRDQLAGLGGGARPRRPRPTRRAVASSRSRGCPQLDRGRG